MLPPTSVMQHMGVMPHMMVPGGMHGQMPGGPMPQMTMAGMPPHLQASQGGPTIPGMIPLPSGLPTVRPQVINSHSKLLWLPSNICERFSRVMTIANILLLQTSFLDTLETCTRNGFYENVFPRNWLLTLKSWKFIGVQYFGIARFSCITVNSVIFPFLSRK